MAKVEKDPFRCSECGWTSQKWVGRCGECQAWGSVEELAAPKKLSLVAGTVTSKATPIGDVDLSAARARATGVSELDRVLGGGLVPGAAILLAGEPGVGKSTLLLQMAGGVASVADRSLQYQGIGMGPPVPSPATTQSNEDAKKQNERMLNMNKLRIVIEWCLLVISFKIR